MPIKIIIADDHTIVRQGIKALLEREGFKVVAEASNGQEAIRIAEQHHPDIAVLDLGMPILNGIDASREILKISPNTRTILLTMYKEDHYVVEGLRAGAKGFVMKTHAAEDLIKAIHEASRGRAYLSPEISETVVLGYQAKLDLRPEPLSSRERQVLQLIAEGKTTKEAASILNISVKTAESHRTRIMEKLDIHETASLVRYAIRKGLVQP